MLHRETDLALDLAIGIVARELPTGPVPIPDKTFRIHDKPVGHPIFIWHAREETAIADCSVDRVIVQDDDLVMTLVCHIYRLAIWADADTVRCSITRVKLME